MEKRSDLMFYFVFGEKPFDKYRLLHGIFHIIQFISHRSWHMNEGW